MPDDRKKGQIKAQFNQNKAPRIRTVPMPADVHQDDIILADWLMAYMDIAGGAEAYEFTEGRVVTAGIEAMSFEAPVHVGDDVSIYTDIAYVGRSSVGISIEAWARNRKTGQQEQVTSGLFTFVSTDQNGKPQPIQNKRGYPPPPSAGKQDKSRNLDKSEKGFLKDLPQRLKGQIPSRRIEPMPKDRNGSGDIFGGWILAQMDKACAAEAQRLTGQKFATVGVEAMTFHKPVHVGDDLSFYTEVVHTGNTSVGIKVESWAYRKDTKEHVKVTEGVFSFVALDENKHSTQLNLPAGYKTRTRNPGPK